MILLGSIHRNELERMVDQQLNLESMKAFYAKRTIGKELPIPALPPHMQRTESESSCASTASVSVVTPHLLHCTSHRFFFRLLSFALCLSSLHFSPRSQRDFLCRKLMGILHYLHPLHRLHPPHPITSQE